MAKNGAKQCGGQNFLEKLLRNFEVGEKKSVLNEIYFEIKGKT